MGNIFSFGWEDSLIIFIQQRISGPAASIAAFLSEFGDAMILVGVVGLFYWALNKDLGKRLILYLGVVNVVGPCLKSLVKRLRPYMANRDILPLKAVNNEGDVYDVVSQEYSFPSGHADSSIAVYGPLMKRSRKLLLRIALILLVLLIGITRFVLGVHYPTDVLAGWVTGILCIALYGFLEKKLGRYKTYLLLDAVCLLGFLVARSNDFYTGYGLLAGSTLGIIFEEKKVNFAGTKNVFAVILRALVGVLLYLGLNSLLKLPFSADFLNSGTLPAFAVRALRYTVVCFVLVGIYPLSFRFFEKKDAAA